MQRLRFCTLLSRSLALTALFSLLAFSPALRAQEPATSTAQNSHLVSPAQLQQQMQTAAGVRDKNIKNLNQFLASPVAAKAMKDAKIDPLQVKTAIPTLSDAELANLSARATKAQNDFAAGRLSVLYIALIIVALVILILILAYH